MCHALASCNCKSTQYIDEFYDICIECHRLLDRNFSAPPPTAEAKKSWSPNAAMAERIKSIIESDWAELTALRTDGVAWTTILKSKGYDFSDTTLAKHYRNMLAEKEPDTPKRKRGVFKNPSVVKKNFKQENIYFGSQA